ncbi:MAG: type III-A CRISPR-associated RAMP protein Csm4 [Anaerolineae bacterium]
MQVHIYHLRALSPFHLGERGIGLEASEVVAHADTVFSALCSVGREVYGVRWLEDLLAAFWEAPPFLLSSAFPYAAAGDAVLRLYPRPLGIPPGVGAGDAAATKRIKSVEFVSEAIFLKWIAGQSLAAEMPDDTTLVQEKNVWVSRAELSDLRVYATACGEGQPTLWCKSDVPRVTVDRIQNSSAVYQAGRVTFQRGGGLWVGFVWGSDTELANQIDALLRVLGHAGMGGERSSGHGQFEVAGSVTVDLPDAGDAHVLLSTYWPRREGEAAALADPRAAYKLMVRRGWIGSPEGGTLRRKAVRMLSEGSVLPGEPHPRGGLVDVTPDALTAHRVYRYGYALPVGMTGGAT